MSGRAWSHATDWLSSAPLSAGLTDHGVLADQLVAGAAGVDGAVLELAASQVDLALGGVRQLRALLLWADTGEATDPVTEAEFPLVLTAGVRVAPGHALHPSQGGRLLVPGRAVLLRPHTPPGQASQHSSPDSQF